MKLIGQSFEKREGLAGKFVALGFFSSDGEKADAGPGDFEDAASIHFAHYCELLEVLRFAVYISANIEQDAGIAFRCRHGCGQSRAINARQNHQNHLGRGHSSAGITGGYAQSLRPYPHAPA